MYTESGCAVHSAQDMAHGDGVRNTAASEKAGVLVCSAARRKVSLTQKCLLAA